MTRLLALCLLALPAGASPKETSPLLLPNSSEPLTMDECQRAAPHRGRPQHVVSFQNGTGTPWHHRTCTWSDQ